MPCKTLWLPLPHIRMWQCCTLHCLAFPCPLKQRATDNLEAAAMRKTLEMSGHRKEFSPTFLYLGSSLRSDASDDIKIQVILAPSFSWQDVKGYCCQRAALQEGQSIRERWKCIQPGDQKNSDRRNKGLEKASLEQPLPYQLMLWRNLVVGLNAFYQEDVAIKGEWKQGARQSHLILLSFCRINSKQTSVGSPIYELL